jgi:signal transduction histidine kinase
VKRHTSRRRTEKPLPRSAKSSDPTRKRGPPRPRSPLVDLGIAGRRVSIHSHLAYFWETAQDFDDALGFLEAGLRVADHCVVIGDRRDIAQTLNALEGRGLDVDGLRAEKRLTVLERRPKADEMLADVTKRFEAASKEGVPVVRLLGNVGWGRATGPPDAELASYEARLTSVARKYPSVVLCLHEVRSLTGLTARHGVLTTHPEVLDQGQVFRNPYFNLHLGAPERSLERAATVRATLSEHQREREERERLENQLRALSEKLQVVREEERARIAREVHDEVGQALSALQMDVAWLEKKLATSPKTAPESCVPKLKAMSALLDTTLGSVQRIATELRPGVLDELGLEAATEWYVRDFESRTGIPCDFRSDLKGAPVEPGLATAVFRILQEALTNVVRHSGANRVEILLSADTKELRLEVRDNGRGIPKDQVASHSLGLLGMRERARSLGGELSLRGTPGVGTTVTLRVPR